MTTHYRWETAKARRREIDPGMDDPVRRAAARDQQNAKIVGYQLGQMRKNIGMTQAQVAKALGVSAARISQMENGAVEKMHIETIADYITALGGQLRLLADFGESNTAFVDFNVDHSDQQAA